MTDQPADHFRDTGPGLVRDTGDSVIRHEQHLLVGTERYPIERVRVEKRIVTEERTITVTVRREEIRVAHEPLDPDAPLTGPATSGNTLPDYITVSEERPVITMQVVPVERVRLLKKIVTEQRTVSDTVGHEEIEVRTTGA